MTNTRATQGHKVAIMAGGGVPARIPQAQKIVLISVGATPSQVPQAFKVFITNAPEGQGQSRRRGFMSFNP